MEQVSSVFCMMTIVLPPQVSDHVQVIFIPRFMYLCTRTLIHSISVYIHVRGNVCFPREQCEGQLQISDRKSFCVCSVNSHPIQHLAFT